MKRKPRQDWRRWQLAATLAAERAEVAEGRVRDLEIQLFSAGKLGQQMMAIAHGRLTNIMSETTVSLNGLPTEKLTVETLLPDSERPTPKRRRAKPKQRR